MSDPIFKAVFGDDWGKLPSVFHRHYANRSFHDDTVTVDGMMTVESSPMGRLLNPLFRLTRTLVPYEGNDVPATVHFISKSHSAAFGFERIFYFPGKPPYHFRSSMFHIKDQEVIEVMRFGLGWRMIYHWDGQKIILRHKGYAIRLFGSLIPLPLEFFIGRGYAEEIPADDQTFSMMMEIRHPLWGKVFGYSGIFKVVKDK